MSWTFKLVTSPVDEFDASVPGLVSKRLMLSSSGQPFHESVEMNLGPEGQPFLPSITGMKPRRIVSDRLRGSARVTRPLRELIRMRIAVDNWTPAEWAQFSLLHGTQRLVAFSPNWGPRTWWASTFAGKDEGGGIAEVGVSGPGEDQYKNRHPNTAWESPVMGAEQLMTGNANDPEIMRLVPGMIGRAALLESDKIQYANSAGAWSSGGATVASTGGSNTPFGPGYTLLLDATDFPIYTATSSVSAGSYHCMIYMRGSGTVRLEAENFDGSADGPDVVLTDQWQKTSVSFTTSSAGGIQPRIRERTGTDKALVQVSMPSVSSGLYPLSAIDSAKTPSNPDKIFLDTTIPAAGGGMTWVFWWKKHEANHAEHAYFASWQDGASNRWIRINNGVYNINVAGVAHGATSVAPAGSWVQLVVRLEITSLSDFKTRIHENGVSIGGGTQASPVIPIGDNGIYIGSDLGFGSPTGVGLNSALDSVRLDASLWTNQQILDDYTMRSDPGIQALLSHTAGRLFQMTSVPQGFLGPYTDQIVGDLVLEEVAHHPTGLI